MVKKNRNYRYDGKTVPLTEIYRLNKKRPGRSKYLLSVQAEQYRRADEGSEEAAVPVRLVFVRKHGNKKQYLVLLSTDTSLSEEEIIRVYGKRWGGRDSYCLFSTTSSKNSGTL